MAEFDREQALLRYKELQAQEAPQPKSKKQLAEELGLLEAEAAIWRRRLEDVVLAHQAVLMGDPPTNTLEDLVQAKFFLGGRLAKIYSDICRVLRELDGLS